MGLDWERESRFRYNMVKGRVAEALIEELFQAIGFKVYRFGMENTVPEMRGQLARSDAKVATLIRTMPDFVVQAPGEDPRLVEVKFRALGRFGMENVHPDYAYGDVLFVVVSKRHIKALTYRELKAGYRIEASDARYLGSRPEFARYRGQIVTFCKFATRFFEAVPEGEGGAELSGRAPAVRSR